MLEKERQFFERERDHLVESNEGRFVLIHQDEIGGVFESKEDAITQGYSKYGNVPFLVKQIQRIETPMDFVSSLLAI